MFIAKDYDLHLDAPGCEPGAEYWNATARFQEDISDVFPYLNAQWKDVIYSPAAKQITWRVEGTPVALKLHEITISNLPDRDTATIEWKRSWPRSTASGWTARTSRRCTRRASGWWRWRSTSCCPRPTARSAASPPALPLPASSPWARQMSRPARRCLTKRSTPKSARPCWTCSQAAGG